MALSDFNVSVSDVVQKLPINASSISATTTPLSTTDIEAFISDAESIFAGLLSAQGRGVGELSEDALRQIQGGIKAYAVSECFLALGFPSKGSDDQRARFDEVRSMYASSPQSLAGSASRVKSNVDTSGIKKRFVGRQYKF